MIDERLRGFIHPDYRYNFNMGPHIIRSDQEARKFGVNCVALGHLALYILFGRKLDPSLGCNELYRDHEQFAIVPTPDDMQIGDLVFFGLERPKAQIDEFSPQYDADGQILNWQDSPLRHIATYTGERNESSYPLLLHATHLEGTNVIWPLDKFLKYKRYKKVWGIRRLQDASPVEPSYIADGERSDSIENQSAELVYLS